MTTPREIRETNAREHLIEALRKSEHGHFLEEYPLQLTPRGFIVGPVEVLPGEKAEEPVFRDAARKSLLPGSGRYPRRVPEADITPENGASGSTPVAYREAPTYREAFERLFPAGGDPDERGSLAWLFDQFWSAVEGSPQLVDCPHPEWHDEQDHKTPKKHVVAFKKEAATMFKMIELGVGRAAQTINIHSKEEKLIKVLEQRQIDVTLHGIELPDVDAKRSIIEGFGYEIVSDSEPSERPVLDAGGEREAGESA